MNDHDPKVLDPAHAVLVVVGDAEGRGLAVALRFPETEPKPVEDAS